MISSLRNAIIVMMLVSGVVPVAWFTNSIEHFPYGIFLIFFCTLSKKNLLLFSVMVFSYLLSVLYWDYFSLKYLIQSINVISPLFFARKYLSEINYFSRIVFFVYVAVGFLQYLGLLDFTEPVMRLLISRFEGSQWGGYRGVSMLESEPARASFQIIILFLVGRPLGKLFGRTDYLMIFLLIISQVVFIKSTTGFLMSLLVLVSIYYKAIITRPYLLVVLSVGSMIVLYKGLATNPKVLTIFNLFMTDGLTGLYNGLAATSGGRFLGLVNSLSDIIRWPFGYGSDESYFAFNQVGTTDDIVVDGYKTHIGNRVVSSIIMYIRVYGVFVFAYLLYLVRLNSYRKKIPVHSWMILLILSIYSPPGSESVLLAFIFSSYWVIYGTKKRH